MTRVLYDCARERGQDPCGPAALRTIRRPVHGLFRATCPARCGESVLGRPRQRQRAQVDAGDARPPERRRNLPSAPALHYRFAVADGRGVGAPARAHAGTLRHSRRRRHGLPETGPALGGRQTAVLRGPWQNRQLSGGRLDRIDRRYGLAHQLRAVSPQRMGRGSRPTRQDARARLGALSREMADRPGPRPRGAQDGVDDRGRRSRRRLRDDHRVSRRARTDGPALRRGRARSASRLAAGRAAVLQSGSHRPSAPATGLAPCDLGPRDQRPVGRALCGPASASAARSWRTLGPLRTVLRRRRAGLRS